MLGPFTFTFTFESEEFEKFGKVGDLTADLLILGKHVGERNCKNAIKPEKGMRNNAKLFKINFRLLGTKDPHLGPVVWAVTRSRQFFDQSANPGTECLMRRILGKRERARLSPVDNWNLVGIKSESRLRSLIVYR